MSASPPPLPETEVVVDPPRLALPGRANPASAGWEWIAGGWRLFLRAPLMWIIAMILIFIAVIAIGIVPLVGAIAIQLLQPVIGAGLIVACHSLDRGGPFELEHLFAGFRKSFGSLLVVGLLFMVLGFLILLVFVAFIAFSIGAAALSFDASQILNAVAASVLTIALGFLVTLALLVPLFAAYWFAPALVVMHDLSPVDAMKESLFGCFRNFVAFVVYGIIVLILAILAMIPFGLGYLVLIPVTMGSIYAGYRQIFTEEAAAEAVPRPTL